MINIEENLAFHFDFNKPTDIKIALYFLRLYSNQNTQYGKELICGIIELRL